MRFFTLEPLDSYARRLTQYDDLGNLKTARHLGTSYRELLGTNQRESSVTDIAMRFGFAQLGKFSVEYRRTFGESPSTTLAH